MKTVQLFLNNFFLLLCWQFGMWDQSMLHRSRNSGRDFWWNQLPCGPVLTPISCAKFKIQSAYEDSPIVPKQVFFSCACNLECGTSQCFTDQETQKEIFGETSFLVGQFLHPSPVQSSRSIQCIQTIQLFLNNFFLYCAGNLDEGPVYASQIKKLRKRVLVEPAPLWSSSYTHLLYKAHDPFSAWTQSNCSLNKAFFLSCAGNLDERPVDASRIKKLRKRFLVEPAPLLASSYTHLLYKAQDPFSHEDSAVSETSSYFSPFLWDQVYASQIKKLRKRFLVEPAPLTLWASSYTHLLYKAQDPFSACRQSNCS